MLAPGMSLKRDAERKALPARSNMLEADPCLCRRSKLSQYFIRTFAAPRLGNTFVETKIIHLLKFKIPELSDKQRNQIITLVNQILAAKKKDPNANISSLEKQIDEMVYKLYGLTPEEIEIVDVGR